MEPIQRVRRLFAFFFAAFFFVVLCIVVFRPPTYVWYFAVYPFTWYGMLLSALLWCVFLWGAHRWLSNITVRNRLFTEIGIVALMFVLFFAVQLFLAHEFENEYHYDWDFVSLASNARNFILYKLPDDGYLANYQNNIPAYLMICFFFRVGTWFGNYHFMQVGAIFNALLVDLSLLLMYFLVRRSYGRKIALITLLFGMLTLPLLFYTAIFYTDTTTMIYPVLAVLLWLHAKAAFASKKKLRAALLLLGIVAAVAVGAMLKMSVAVVMIAVLIDALISYGLKPRFWAVLAAVAVFGSSVLWMSGAMKTLDRLSAANPEVYHPLTMWIMMGLHDDGNFYYNDFAYTESFPPGERDQAVRDEILRRIEEYGFGGMVEHLVKKTAFTWGEGTYTTPYKLFRNRVRPSMFDKYVVAEAEHETVYAVYCQGMMVVTLLGLVVAAVRAALKKRAAAYHFVATLAIFGLALFLLVWETRSRYLVNFIPLFLAVGVPELIRVSGEAAAWIERRLGRAPRAGNAQKLD